MAKTRTPPVGGAAFTASKLVQSARGSTRPIGFYATIGALASLLADRGGRYGQNHQANHTPGDTSAGENDGAYQAHRPPHVEAAMRGRPASISGGAFFILSCCAERGRQVRPFERAGRALVAPAGEDAGEPAVVASGLPERVAPDSDGVAEIAVEPLRPPLLF